MRMHCYQRAILNILKQNSDQRINMLVLSRHRDEKIIIGEPGPNQVSITIIDIRGDKVRLGIDADQKVPVHRQEVYDAIMRERNNKARNDDENK